MRQTCLRRFVQQSFEKDRPPKAQYEVGVWNFSPEKMRNFSRWCQKRNVRAYKNVKIAGTAEYARCLRALKDLAPGQAIITAPPSACFNFLVAARQQMESPNGYPIQLDWMNWDRRLDCIRGSSHAEFGTAGWMVRSIALQEEPFHEYFQWLIDDSRNKDGVAQGISKEKGDESPQLDMLLSQMASDSCEEPEIFLENFFHCYAALMCRGLPIEPHGIEVFMSGTTFFKSKIDELFVPTLVPFVDCVPHKENGGHNTFLEFITPERLVTERDALMYDLGLDNSELAVYEKEGFFALRSIGVIEQGEMLYARGWPKMGVAAEKEAALVQGTHVSTMQQNELANGA